ncbi:ACT-like protein tyrosine kinase family protein [Euphorbia peplus]|nr:ACT-like protein tyrosine kinase family protein [Euphorbia peplus]
MMMVCAAKGIYVGMSIDSSNSDSTTKEDAQSSYFPSKQSIHPPPTFGSSPNLEAVALQANRFHVDDGDGAVNSISHISRPMHEIIFSTVDRPKLLSEVGNSFLYTCF